MLVTSENKKGIRRPLFLSFFFFLVLFVGLG